MNAHNLVSIGTLNIQKSTNCNELFSGCSALNTISSLNVSACDELNESNIFNGCTSFQEFPDLSAQGSS